MLITNRIQAPTSEHGAAILGDLLQRLGQPDRLHAAAIEDGHLQLEQRYVMYVLVLWLVPGMHVYGRYPGQLAGIAVNLIATILQIQLLWLRATHTMRRCQHPARIQQCRSTRVRARFGTAQ